MVRSHCHGCASRRFLDKLNLSYFVIGQSIFWDYYVVDILDHIIFQNHDCSIMFRHLNCAIFNSPVTLRDVNPWQCKWCINITRRLSIYIRGMCVVRRKRVSILGNPFGSCKKCIVTFWILDQNFTSFSMCPRSQSTTFVL